MEFVPARPSDQHGVTHPPNLHFLCYDYLYYVCALKVMYLIQLLHNQPLHPFCLYQPFEYSMEYSPAWRYAGRYMRWTDRLDQLADQYVRRALGTADGVPSPLVEVPLHYITLISDGHFSSYSTLLSMSATTILPIGVVTSL